MSDWESAETIEECQEMATVDCYNEDEQISGWECCLSEVLDNIKKVKVFGEIVKFKDIEIVGAYSIVAICQKGKKEAKVTLDSVELIDAEEFQQLWIDAWIDWSF